MALVPVAAIFVDCSYQLRNFNGPGIAASDCCGRHATTAVEDEGGNYRYRCGLHAGQVRSGRRGRILTHIPKKLDF